MTTVLLSRPTGRADRLIDLLTAAGHSVINAPVTRIEPVDVTDLPPLDGLSGTIFSSAAAVPHVPDSLKAAALALPALAVGPVTADALTADGWQNVRHFGGEMPALLEALKHSGQTRSWAYPCGAQTAHDPADMAAVSRTDIYPITVYAAKTCPDWNAEQVALLQRATIDVTVFLSVRTAQLFIAQCERAGLWQAGAPGVAGCISARVAEAIAPLGYASLAVSREKTTSSLVAALGLT